MVIVVGPRSRSARGSDGGVGRSRTNTFIGWPGGWMSAASENESFLILKRKREEVGRALNRRGTVGIPPWYWVPEAVLPGACSGNGGRKKAFQSRIRHAVRVQEVGAREDQREPQPLARRSMRRSHLVVVGGKAHRSSVRRRRPHWPSRAYVKCRT